MKVLLLQAIKLEKSGEEKITFDYDEEADVLYVSFGKPRKAITEEIGNIGIRVDPKTKRIVGVTIGAFLEMAKKNQKPITVSLPEWSKIIKRT